MNRKKMKEKAIDADIEIPKIAHEINDFCWAHYHDKNWRHIIIALDIVKYDIWEHLIYKKLGW